MRLLVLTEEEASHIGTVHLYNGPNAYPILTPEQKVRIDSLKYKIYNHIDHKDLVSLGLSGFWKQGIQWDCQAPQNEEFEKYRLAAHDAWLYL